MSLQGPIPEEPRTTTEGSATQLRKFGPPAVLGLLALIFVLQNLDTISVEFLWMDFRAQLWLLLVIFAAIGAVVFWALARRRRSRKAKQED
jgi:uncharacterized integral membrane protein